MAEIAKITIPTEFPNDEFIIVIDILVSSGDYVNKNDLIMVVEYTKATIDIESHVSGYIEVLCSPQQEVSVGDLVAVIYDSPHDFDASSSKIHSDSDAPNLYHDSIPPSTKIEHNFNGKPIFSNKAKSDIEKENIDPEIFQGKPFIRSSDIQEILTSKAQKPHIASSGRRHSLRIPATPLKLHSSKTAEIYNLLGGQNTITSCFQKAVRCNITPMQHNKPFKNINIVPIILQECCKLLKEYRLFNAYLHEDTIYLYQEINIGYAIDLGKGLSIINLGDILNFSLDKISKLILRGTKSYMRGQISRDDISKVTFIITDLSNSGVNFFTPLIGLKQSATLGICGLNPETQLLNLTFTFDHRVTEGRQAATFLDELSRKLETILAESTS